MKRLNSRFFILLLIGIFYISNVKAQSPTPGFIYLPATGVGATVLDPNSDGYSSVSANGFATNDVSESEIPFVGVSPLFPELPGDNTRGPGCGFTDLVESNGSGVYSYLDASNNLMFRFRLGNSIKGSKAYSILIDTDGKMGNVGANADPNYIGGTKGNPGFEMEIVLETNFRVALYDVDGSTSGILKASLPVDQYSQESVALSTVCGDPDYFYDFFIPFSVISTYFPSVTPATPVRFLGVTVMAPREALGGPTSDTYGVPDNGNWNQEWTDIINAQPPTCFACTGGGYPVCSDPPVVNTAIAVGATAVSGTSTEANGTTIRIYKNSILIGTTTVTAGAWSLSSISPALVNNDTITAKAQAIGEAACLFSNQVIILAGCTSSPTITCLTKKGAQGNGPATAPIGTTIKGYELTSTGPVLVFTVVTTVGNVWTFDCGSGGSGCTGGVNCVNNGSYYVTATAPGQCESIPSSQFDLTCGSASTTPTVTTNPIYDFTTTIAGTSSTATGQVYMFINGAYYSSVAISASTWSFSGLSLVSGSTLTFKKVDGTNCMSAPTTKVVICRTSIATINTPLVSGEVSISGTSTEAAGTTITIYKNGVSIGITSVLVDGTWTKSSIAPLITGDNIYVTQTSSTCSVSLNSPTSTVVGVTPPPVIVGTYYEQNSTVNGTSPSPAGTIIRVYIDGYFIGTTTVLAGGTWSLAGLDSTILYAGGILSATAQESGLGVSVLSNLVPVNCVLPSPTISATSLTPFICKGDSARVLITGTENLVVYTIVNQSTTTALSVSRLGNGMNLTVLTFALSSSQWIKVKAEKIGGPTCSVYLSDSLYITVSNYPDSTLSNSGPGTVCSGSPATITVNNSQSGMQYQIRDSISNANVGSAVAGNGGTISLITGTITSPKTYYVWVINNSTSANCSRKLNGYIRVDVSTDILSNAGSNQALCNVTTISLAGNSPAPGNGTWTLVSGPNVPTITTPSSQSSTVTAMIPGVYTFRWTIINGACTEFSDVQITIYASPTVSNAGPNQSLCNVTTTTLAGNAPGAGTGNWTQVSGPNSATITSSISPGSSVSNLIAGVYIFRWTISNGNCAASTSDVQISIYDLPTTANAGANQNLCNVSSTTLAGNTPVVGSGSWSLISGPNAPSITSPSSASTTVTGMIAGTYIFRWTITNGSCTSSTSNVQIIIYDTPSTANAGANQNLCNVTSTTLNGNSPTTGTAVWTLVSGPNSPTITTTSSPTTSVTGMIAGTYTFRWTISNGVCTSTTSDVQIIVYTLPTVSNAGPDQSLCNVTSTTLAGNTPIVGSGTWSQLSGPNSATIVTPTSGNTSISNLLAGVYNFRWAISNGVCTTSFSDVQITIFDLPTVSNAGPDQNLCNVTSTTLASNTPTIGLGNWTLISGPNSPMITSPASATSTVTGMITGTYLFRWTISNGSCLASTDDMQIIIYATPSTSAAGADQALCNVSSATMAANTPTTGSGNWSVISGPNSPTITSSSNPTTTITGLIPGVYTIRWTIGNGVCAVSTNDVQITIYSLPTISNAGGDQDICNATTTTLIGNAPSSGAGIWSFVSGPNTPSISSPASPTTSVTGMVAGSYVFRWTISSGVCSTSTDDILVTIYPTPTIANAGSNQSLCDVTSVTLSGNVPLYGTGSWSFVSGPNTPLITAPGNNTTTVTGTIPGTYIFSWNISSGVCTTSTSNVQIIIYATPDISNAGVDQSLCNVPSTTLNSNSPLNGNGVWSLISGPGSPVITNDTTPSSTVTGLVAGTYIFRWTISNGVCVSSTDDVSINIYDLPTTADAGIDESFCNVSYFNLLGNSPTVGTGVWTLVSGPNSPVFTDSSIYNTQVTGIIPGTYIFRWTISNGVCSVSSDDVQFINFSSPAIVDAGPDQDLCNTTNTTLAGNTPALGTGTWTVISGPNVPVFSSINNPNASLSSLISGTYLLGWKIDNGTCTTPKDTVVIQVFSLPTTANAGSDQSVCSTTTIFLSSNAPAVGTGVWTLISGPNSPTISNPANNFTSVTGVTAGTYIFRWTISNGNCAQSIDEVQIDIYNIPLFIDAGPDQQLCNLSSATLAGNAPAVGVGTWTLLNGPSAVVFANPNDPSTNVSSLIPGTYNFGWLINNGVCSSPKDTMSLVIYDLPTIADAGTDINLCNLSSVNLSANNPLVGNGYWSILSGPNTPVFADSSQNNSSISNLITGVYELLWTISNGVCASNSDSLRLTDLDVPPIADAGADQNLCDVNSTTLAGNNSAAATGTWSLISGPNAPTISNPNLENTTVTGMVAGTYSFQWTIANGVCALTTDTVIVIISALPTVANAGPDQNLCSLVNTNFNAVSLVTGVGQWNQIGGPNLANIDSADISTSLVSGMIPGIYSFTWTVSNGSCAITIDTMSISIDQNPSTANAGADQSLCNTSSISLSAINPIIGIGNWTFVSGPNVPTIVSPSSVLTSVNGIIPGDYIFEWSVSNGVCATSFDSVNISVSAIPITVNAGVDQDLCNVSSISLGADNASPGNGNWTLVSGPNTPSITDTTNENTTVTGLTAGVYIFRWTITSSICSPLTDDVQFTINDFPSNANAGSDQNLCNATNFSMNALAPTTGIGNWNQISGPTIAAINSPSNESSTVSGLTAGAYLFTWTISNGVCANSVDTVLISIYDNPSIASAGSDQVLCNVNSISLSANNPTTGTATWTFNSGPNTPVISSPGNAVTNVNGLIEGTYLFEWSISNGVCSTSVDSVYVTISDIPLVVDAGNDQELCNTTGTNFNALPPTFGIGQWSQISGPTSATFVFPNDPSSQVNNLSPGVYQFGWTITNGSCTSITDTTLITIYANPDIANAGIDQSLCNVTSANLSAVSLINGEGLWTSITGPNSPTFNSPTSSNSALTNLIEGDYVLVWTVSNGVCYSTSDTVLVKVSNLPSVANCGNDQQLCNAGSVTINADLPSSGSGVWTLGTGPSSVVIASPSSAVSLVNGLITGQYVFFWTVSNGSCTSTVDSLVVTISGSVTMPDAGADQSLCNLNSAQLNANPAVNGTGLWTFSLGNASIVSPSIQNTIVNNLSVGTYILRWTISDGTCSAYDEMQLTISPSPALTIADRHLFSCNQSPVTLTASGANTYVWYPRNSLSDTSIYNPIATPRASITYFVIGTDMNGCTAIDSAFVEVCDTLIIPNGFSPDGDGVNDEFVITGIENYPGNVLRIFNRWGNIIYEKNNYDNSWNGTVNTGSLRFGGGRVTTGTYFYILELGPGEKARSGYIVIRY